MSQHFVNRIDPVPPATQVALAGSVFKGAAFYDVDHPDFVSSGDADDTGKLTRAFAAAATAGAIARTTPGKTYSCLSVPIPSGLQADLRGSTFQKNGGGVGTTIFNLIGTTGASQNLTLNAAIGDLTVTVGSTASFTAGDFVLVQDLTYEYATSGQNLEVARVLSVGSSTVLNLAWPLDRSYATVSTASVAKLIGVNNVLLRGGTLKIPTGTAGGGLYGVLTVDCTTIDLNVIGMDDMPGIRYDKSRNPRILRGVIRDGQNVATQSHGYGYLFNESCLGSLAWHVKTENIRENPVSNGSRDTEFAFCKDYGALSSAYNTHGTGTRRTRFTKCVSYQPQQDGIGVCFNGNSASDYDVTIDGFECYNAGRSAVSVNGDVGKEPKNVKIIAPKVQGFGRLIGNSAGILLSNAIDWELSGGDVDGLSGANALQAVLLNSAKQGIAHETRVKNVTRGFQQTSCTDVKLADTWAANCSGNTYFSAISATRVKLENTNGDATTYSLLGTEEVELDTLKNVSADKGDANFTWIAWQHEGVILYNTPLTAGRTVTLATPGFKKAKVRTVRTAAATGAFNLTVAGKALAVGQFVEHQWSTDLSTYVETAFGSL